MPVEVQPPTGQGCDASFGTLGGEVPVLLCHLVCGVRLKKCLSNILTLRDDGRAAHGGLKFGRLLAVRREDFLDVFGERICERRSFIDARKDDAEKAKFPFPFCCAA